MTNVDPTSSGTSGAAAGSTASLANSGLNQLDNTQTFLNLLVAQLKNQDPDNPSDPTAFMTEIAQLTAVQSQTTLDSEEQTVAANSMLGTVVSGTTSNGPITGTVTSVLLPSTGAPELVLGGGQATINLDQVNQVYSTAGYSTSSSSSSNSSSSSSQA